MRSNSLIHIAKNGYLFLSAAYVILGILALADPRITYLLLTRTLAIVWIITGFVRIVSYFSRDLYELAFQYDLALGVLMIIIGCILFCKAAELITVFTIVVGIGILSDGLFKIQMSLDARKFGIEKWWIMMLFAVITCVFGAVLIFEPDTSSVLIMTILGIGLICEGLLNFAVTSLAVKINTKRNQNIYEAEFEEREV